MDYPNMSYCMFQNTRSAMQQLIYAMEEGGGELLENLSKEERRAFDDLLDMAETYSEMAHETVMDFEESKQD